jgi:MFS family permease
MLSISATSIMVLVGGIVGAELAPDPIWSTLPISLMTVGLALTTIPSAMAMKRVGRRLGFSFSAVVAICGALLAAYAVMLHSFSLFCLGSLLVGTNSAYVQQYRFAAVESVEPRLAGRAVSLTLLGGVLAGILGPEIARRSQDMLPSALYVGSFISMAVLYVLVLVMMLFFKDVSKTSAEQLLENGAQRPLRKIILQPVYITALLSGMAAYGIMSFIMTATPVHMHNLSGFSLGDTSLVIQSHIIAMFLPSLFSGYLLDRLGAIRVMLAGLAAITACVLLGVASAALVQYWGALVLLGVGWNFLFVGATVLLTRSYLPPERYKAQAFNEFAIFSVQAMLSLSAGVMLYRSNWDTLNLSTLPLLLLVLASILLVRKKVEEPSQALASVEAASS